MQCSHSPKHLCPDRICVTLNVNVWALRTNQDFQYHGCFYSSPVVMSDFYELSLFFLVSPKSSDFSTSIPERLSWSVWKFFVSIWAIVWKGNIPASNLVGVCAIDTLYSYCHLPLYSANDIYAHFTYLEQCPIQCHGTSALVKKGVTHFRQAHLY